MELKYNDITKEQWEIYNAVEKACFIEDLTTVLEENFGKNIDELSDTEIDFIYDKYQDYRSDGSWREDMIFAINRTLED